MACPQMMTQVATMARAVTASPSTNRTKKTLLTNWTELCKMGKGYDGWHGHYSSVVVENVAFDGDGCHSSTLQFD